MEGLIRSGKSAASTARSPKPSAHWTTAISGAVVRLSQARLIFEIGAGGSEDPLRCAQTRPRFRLSEPALAIARGAGPDRARRPAPLSRRMAPRDPDAQGAKRTRGLRPALRPARRFAHRAARPRAARTVWSRRWARSSVFCAPPRSTLHLSRLRLPTPANASNDISASSPINSRRATIRLRTSRPRTRI